MTTTQHTALYRFHVPPVSDNEINGIRIAGSPLMLVDLIDLANSQSDGAVQVYPDTGRIIGNGTFNPSFGIGQYNAYFCADFTGATIRNTGTFIDEQPNTSRKNLTSRHSDFHSSSRSVGAFVQFKQPKDSITARVGLSFISSQQACDNAEKEIPDFDFELVHQRAREAWAEKLSAVYVNPTGMSDELQTTFWSGIYRVMLSPQDYTGENPFWDSGEPYYDS